MIELFENISSKAKQQASFIFKMALLQPDLLSTVKILNEYTEACLDEEEKQFVEFYFNLELEKLLNAYNNDQR